MNTPQSISPDVARLICGSIEDLKGSLNFCEDAELLKRSLETCRGFRESKVKVAMLERAIRKLEKASSV